MAVDSQWVCCEAHIDRRDSDSDLSRLARHPRSSAAMRHDPFLIDRAHHTRVEYNSLTGLSRAESQHVLTFKHYHQHLACVRLYKRFLKGLCFGMMPGCYQFDLIREAFNHRATGAECLLRYDSASLKSFREAFCCHQ